MKKNIFIIVLILFLGGTMLAEDRAEKLSNSVLRLHVIANSDEPADQLLKLQVKDDIVAMMKDSFRDIDSSAVAIQMAQQETPRIQAVAEARVASSGYDYPVVVQVGEYDFPVKSYGNLVFPPGQYQAVRVIIGDGAGKNWWCVLFPPLCLVSSSDQGLSLNNPREARITLKCLELLPQGVKLGRREK